MTTMADLQQGERGRVLEIAGDDEITIRLYEMGLTPGVEVQFVGRAPLGDPLEFEVRGYRLSVRRSEARQVQVERDEGA